MKVAQGGTGKGVAATIPDVTTLPYFTAVSPILGVNPATGAPITVLGPTGCPSGVPACPVPAGTIVPLPLGSLMKMGYGVPCAVAPLPMCNNPLPDNATLIGTTGVPGLLYPSEVSLLKSRGAEYNAQIKSLAEGAGYKVFDTAALMADIAAKGRTYGGVTYTSSYLAGGVFSYDGVHPSAVGYAVIADELVQFVNAQFGTTLPRVDMYPYLFNGNSQSGGFPVGAHPSQDEVIEWAAAYFGEETLNQLFQLFPLPAAPLTVGTGDGEPQTGARDGRIHDLPGTE
ncbi:SGNH/GDSL hydrolase family protein [Acidobacteria bacterium ACD]|nr:SGNH/GDSL hydrolase family protein [Acidobacteria bacterium ACD]